VNVEIDGMGRGQGSHGVLGIHGTVQASNIHGVENGITPGSDTLVVDNYIHDLAAPGAPHYDGIQIDGGRSNIAIRHNSITAPAGPASAVLVVDWFGPVDHVVVEQNRLAGGAYTVTCDGSFGRGAITGVRYLSNRFGPSATGPAFIRDADCTGSGNVEDRTGLPVALG
jgi:hypothetical protein